MQNLVRGRGLFCRSVMKSQMASPAFTPVYCALVAVINTKFPEIGELLLGRVIMQASLTSPHITLPCPLFSLVFDFINPNPKTHKPMPFP
jgi:hypothetical protein